MAQKAAKIIAKRNSQILDRTHMIALLINIVFVGVRAVLFWSSFSGTSLLLYALLSAPALVVEFFFEQNSRPKYHNRTEGSELRKSGEDLEAKGLTEWMWDILYWTWGCTIAATVIGDRAWWLYVAVPMYSTWLAYTTFGSVKNTLGGLKQSGNSDAEFSTSRRQQKMEKRGDQRMRYH